MSRFLHLPHEMKDPLLVRHIKIKIYFHPARMCMRWYGVPYTALGQNSQSHHQLATLYLLVVNVFVYGSLIRGICRAKFNGRSLLPAIFCNGVFFVSG